MSNITWYVEPVGKHRAHTSEVLGREVSEEDVCRDVICNDGRPHNLYRMKWRSVEDARAFASNIHLTFAVWKQTSTARPRRFDVNAVFKGRSDSQVRVTREQLVSIIARTGATAQK